MSAASTKESLDLSNLDRIFRAAGRRSNALLNIVSFCGLSGVADGISTLSPEIRIVSRKFQKNRWKSAKVPELFSSCQKFEIYS